MSTRFLVTGANGYIAMHVIKLLLNDGHQVRGTVRSLADEKKLEPIRKLGPIELVEGANLFLLLI
jgi:nucleoside-diphosphate-sugar epimerase